MSCDINSYIQKYILWNQLPQIVKTKLGNDPNEYNKYILNFSIQNQLRFKGNLIAKVFKSEKRYYEKLISYSKEKMLLYPYHLQDIVIGGLRITSYTYYIDLLCKVMSQEKSYDFIPNFTAADCLRLLGIGRNQYIELMNTLRGNSAAITNSGSGHGLRAAAGVFGRRILGLSTGSDETNNKEFLEKIRSLLPTSPLEDIVIEPWWLVTIGVVLEPDINTFDKEIRTLIDHIIDSGPVLAGTLDRDKLRWLYRQGMVYLDVPIEPYAIVSVPTLEGFVMNRTTSDQFELLLYQIFVAIDEGSDVDSLANILQIPLHMVQQAVSVFCRLQFAHKKPNQLDMTYEMHNSWKKYNATSNRQQQHLSSQSFNNNNEQDLQKFLLDVNNETDFTFDTPSDDIIKSSASMFLTPEIIEDSTDSRCFGEEIQKSGVMSQGPKKVAFIFDSSLTAYLMMGNLSIGLKNHAVTMFEVGKLSDEGLNQFLVELDSICDVGEGEAQRYYEHAVNLRYTIRKLRSFNCSIDLLRCGSLLSLDAASRGRMLSHTYRCLMSMAPINYVACGEEAAASGTVANGYQMSSMTYQEKSDDKELLTSASGSRINSAGSFVMISESNFIAPLCTESGLPHFGPVIPEMTSVWFRLFIHCLTGMGPPSLLLTSGFRLRTLPQVFANYSRLLLTPWQQESMVISMNCALVTINDGLTHGPLLVQGYDCDVVYKEQQQAFPITSSETFPKSIRKLVEILNKTVDLTNKCGYINYLVPDSDDFSDKKAEAVEDYCSVEKELLDEVDYPVTEPKELITSDDIADEYSEEDNEDSSSAILLQLHFGVPLFNDELNRMVLDRLNNLGGIFDGSLLTDNADFINSYDKSIIRLCDQLIRFIHKYSPGITMPNNELTCITQLSKYSGYIIQPRKCLLFCNGNLDFF